VKSIWSSDEMGRTRGVKDTPPRTDKAKDFVKARRAVKKEGSGSAGERR
jgi:hypothetical protein